MLRESHNPAVNMSVANCQPLISHFAQSWPGRSLASFLLLALQRCRGRRFAGRLHSVQVCAGVTPVERLVHLARALAALGCLRLLRVRAGSRRLQVAAGMARLVTIVRFATARLLSRVSSTLPAPWLPLAACASCRQRSSKEQHSHVHL